MEALLRLRMLPEFSEAVCRIDQSERMLEDCTRSLEEEVRGRWIFFQQHT